MTYLRLSLRYLLTTILIIILSFALFFIIKEVLAWTNPSQAPPGGSGVGVIPAGTINLYGGSSAPSDWLLCNGSSVSKNTYPALFSAIGYTYGGSGNNFNLPDLRGRTAVGLGTHADVASLGLNEGVSTQYRRPRHRHTVTATKGATIGNANAAFVPASTADWGGGYPATVGADPVNDPLDAPAYLILNCIIKI